MSIALTDHGGLWKINIPFMITMSSKYLEELIMYDIIEPCIEAEILVGDTSTSKMTEEAITKLQLLQKLSNCINKFNCPLEGTSYEMLIEMKKKIKELYVKWKSIPSSPIYDWLFPNPQMIKTIKNYENSKCPAGWYSTRKFLQNAQNEFEKLCEFGQLNIAQWFYSIKHINNNHAFIIACKNGHLEIAKWLHSLGGIDIHTYHKQIFTMACENGHLNIVQWLYTLEYGSVSVRTHNEIYFKAALYNGQINVARWLYSNSDISNYNVFLQIITLLIQICAVPLVALAITYNLVMFLNLIITNIICNIGLIHMIFKIIYTMIIFLLN